MSKSPCFDVVLFTDFTDTVRLAKVLGAYKIAHVLRQQGHSVLVVDHLHMWRIDELKLLLDRIVGPSTVMVGFSTTFFRNTIGNDVFNPNSHQEYSDINFQITFCPQGKDFENEMISYIKDINPQCKIILGGHNATAQNQNRNVDYVITGHGELSVPDLVNALKQHKQLHQTTRSIWGTFVHHSQEPTGEQFAAGGMIWQPQDVVNTKVLPMETARGCLFNCKFCSFPMRGKKNLDFVMQEDLIYKELQDVYDQFGIDTWSLADDTFNDSDEKLELILRAVNRLTFRPKFWCYARLDLMSVRPHRVQLMHDIGVRAVHLGMETLDPKTGKMIGKGFSPKKQIETIQKIRSTYGDDFMLHGSFIVGLPGEPIASIQKTYERCRSQDIPLHTYIFTGLQLKYDKHWMSEFDINYKKYGFEVTELKDDLVYWKSPHTDYVTAWKTASEWNRESEKDPNYYLSGRVIWSMLNIPGSSFESLAKLRQCNTDWQQVSIDKQNYMQEYKSSLMSWLEKRY